VRFTKVPQAIKAAREAGGTGIAGAYGAENILGRMIGATPALRLFSSASPTARNWAEMFVQRKFAQAKNFFFKSSAQDLETELHWERDVIHYSIYKKTNAIINEYKKRTRKLTQADDITRRTLEDIRLLKNKQGSNLPENYFRKYKGLTEKLLLEEAGRTLRSGIPHAIPEVNKIAETYHEVLNALGKRMVKLRMIPEEVMDNPNWYLRYVPQEANLAAVRNDPATILNLVAKVKERQKTEFVSRRMNLVQKGREYLERFQKTTLEKIENARRKISFTQEQIIKDKSEIIEKTNAKIQALEERREKLRKHIDVQSDKIKKRIERTGDPITEMESVKLQKWEEQLKNYDRQLQKFYKYIQKQEASIARLSERKIKNIDKMQAIRAKKIERWIKKFTKTREKQFKKALARQAAAEEKLAKAQAFDPREWASNWLHDIEHGGYDATGGNKLYIGLAGAQKRRGLIIPDDMLPDFEPFLINNIADLVNRYIHDILPRIKLTEKFPDDTSFIKLKKTITQEYQNLRANPELDIKDKVRLAREEARILEDINILRDRFLGKDRMPVNPYSLIHRTSNYILKLNTMTALGRVVLSSIPDMGRLVARYSAPRVMNVMAGSLQASELAKLSKEEMRTLIGITELQLQRRYHAFSDLPTGLQPLTRLERFLDHASERFGKITLLSYWNQAGMETAALIATDLILGTARKMALKMPLNKLELAKIAESGLDQNTLSRIWNQFNKYGKEKNHVWFPNMAKWDDQEAAKIFQIAIKREVENVWTIPGIGDRPVWTSYQLGRHISQFKSYSFTIIQSAILSGLQYSDRAAAEGFALSMFLGGSLYVLYQLSDGKTPDMSPGRLILESFDRSGILGWISDIDAIIERATEGKLGMSPLLGGQVRSKYTSRDIFALLGGKTAGTIQDIFAVTGAATSMNWTAADVKAFRRLIPYQNVFYMRYLFDGLERGYGYLVGAEEKQKQ